MSATAPTTNGVTLATKPTVVFIHGLWMTPLAWEEWSAYFSAKGYPVLTPGWPGVDSRTPEAIRKDPSPLNGLTIKRVVDSYEEIIKALPTPPIIIGHSFGGLFTEILLSRGLGVAGVVLSPAPPAGIFALPISTVRSTLGVLSNPFTYNSTAPFTLPQFEYTFGNHLKTAAEAKPLWERYAIPSAAHVLWQGALSGLSDNGDAHVDFMKEDRAPLLMVGGTIDHVVPSRVVEKVKNAYKGPAVVDLKIYQGKSHGLVNQSGWEEIADYAIKWLEEKTATK
jgi:non-heme chloroperoxidase